MDHDESPGRPEREGCPVVAYGVARAPLDEVAALRKAPGPPGGPKFPPSMLKHADEQTALALSAVLHAHARFGLEGRIGPDWGVVAAPRYLGRLQTMFHIDRYRRQGASTVSPLIIPHLSLHSPSGTVSLAMGLHGPNFGVGGAHGHLAEGLLSALTLADEGIPGAWLVATAWDPEPSPDVAKHSLVPVQGYAVALALDYSGQSGINPVGTLRLNAASAGAGAEADLFGLARFLDEPIVPGRSSRWLAAIPGGTIELNRVASRDIGALAG
ncbi:MAG: hypothetical protein U0800_03620 [Isosphaeraceae bacterium]